jgi:glucosamine kinase
MNAGYYEGGILHHPLPSLGWALGDEGSGADIGRVILQDALYRRMPEELRILLFGEDGPDLQVVLDQVYRSPLPARWVASHTVRLAGLLEVPYVRNLMLSRFHALAELLVSFFPPGQREVVSATGSVAYGFREILAECLLDRGMTLMEVEPDPLPGLVRYHHRRA